MQMEALIEPFVDSLFVSKHDPIKGLIIAFTHIGGHGVISGRRRHRSSIVCSHCGDFSGLVTVGYSLALGIDTSSTLSWWQMSH